MNAVGKLLADLDQRPCEAWQRSACGQVRPLLVELADNVNATVHELKANRARIHMAPFRDYVKANYEMSSDLAALIGDFVNYGNSKQKMEALRGKLEVSRD